MRPTVSTAHQSRAYPLTALCREPALPLVARSVMRHFLEVF